LGRFGYPPVLVAISVATVAAAAGFRVLSAQRPRTEQNHKLPKD
jgi:hypothetical protein